MTTITVIIPVWNRARLIGRAIDSVLGQTLPAGCQLQVLVVDDASTDALDQVLLPYGSGVVRIRHDINRGAAAARNTGVAVAGDYVAFLDSDDIWLAGKVAAQLTFMREHSFPASCTAYIIARAGRPEIVSPRYGTGALTRADLLHGCFVSPGSTLMFERRLFDEIGPLDTALLRLEDWDWLLRYAHRYDLGFLAKPLARIEIGPPPAGAKVRAALGLLETRHRNDLSPSERRSFGAALSMERAASYYRDRQWLAMIPPLASLLWRKPFGSAALRAVLHNKIGPRT